MNDIGKRILIIGSPGSGKSTFSRKLARITEIPLIHLDMEYWSYGWVETPREEWIKKHENLISGSKWIIDGNYSSTLEMRVVKADTIIFFQLSRAACLTGYFKRVISNRNKTRPDMPEGCLEHFDFEFMKYIWNFPKNSGKRDLEILEKSEGKNIIVFKNRSDANKWINELTHKRSEL